MKDKPIAITILLLMIMAQVGMDLYLASLPTMTAALSTSTTIVQYTFSIYMAGFAVSQLWYGPLSDRYGHRPILLFGLLLYCAMAMMCAWSVQISTLLIVACICLLMASIWLPSNLYTFLAPMFLLQLGAAISFPGATAEVMRPFQGMAGKAAAVLGCTLFVIGSIASAIMSHLPETSAFPLAIIMNVIVILMAVSYARIKMA